MNKNEYIFSQICIEDGKGDALISLSGSTCMHNGKMIQGDEAYSVWDEETGCEEICWCPDPWGTPYDAGTKAECTKICPYQ